METGDKLALNKISTAEITGIYPIGQQVSVTFKDGAYQVLIDGYKGIIDKPLLEALFTLAPVAEVPVAEVPVAEVPVEEVNNGL